jgi:hypothetical protein
MKKIIKKFEMFLLLKEWTFAFRIHKIMNYPPYHRNFLVRFVCKQLLDIRVMFWCDCRNFVIWVLENIFDYEI